MITACLTLLLAWQAPEVQPGQDKPASEARAPTETRLPELEDREARQLAKELSKAMKGKPSMADKKRALDQLVTGTNKAFVKPLVSVITKDKMVLIRRRAAELLAHQPAKAAKPAILKLLDTSRILDTPPVAAALVTGLSRCDYDSKDWAALDGMLERDYSPERIPLQEAILDLVAMHKEKQAIEMLLDNLDQPAPKNVDDASNPPAEYWEARWKCWKAFRPRVQTALFAVTGQRFSTSAEARNWLDKNPLK